MKPLITVIVPVYNIEKYIKRSVESLITQKYSNIEVILVNDGSTDGCAKICDDYALIDSRISVIHKTNGGQSSARNLALEIMKGEYVTFIDGDDYVDDYYLEYLYNILEENRADISMLDHYYVDENDRIIGTSRGKKDIELFSGIDATIFQCYQKRIDNFVWGKLYRSELFADVRFPEGKIYEELGTNYKLYLKCDRIAKGNECHYYYVQRMGSTMHYGFDKRKMDRIEMSEQLLKDLSSVSQELKSAAECRMFVSAVQVLREIPDVSEYREEYECTVRYITALSKRVFLDRNVKLINKIIAAFAIAFGCKNLKKLGKLYKMVFPN